MASFLSQTSSTLKQILLFPTRLLLYLYRLCFRINPGLEVTPQAKRLGDLFRSQIGRECRYLLDDSTSATLTLPSGRALGYAEYGSPTGKPIIMLHGFPGSRLEMAWHHDIAQRLDARIIGVDRPGAGRSAPQPQRTPLDHAADVLALADHLGLRTFAVIGTSGGGPYVMACCARIPVSRLVAAANVCGMGDLQTFRSIGMGWPNYLGYKYVVHWAPWLFRWYAAHESWGSPDLGEEDRLRAWIESIETSDAPAEDLAAWEAAGVDFLRVSAGTTKEFFRNGVETLMQDAKVLGSKWDFRVEDCDPALKLHLWFGKRDRNVSGYHGVEIAERFRGQAKLHYLDETHLSLQVKYHEQILQDLVDDM